MSELESCPFCAKSDKVTIYSESMVHHGELLWIRYGVKCKRCHFEMPTCAKKETAIRKWNTRPAENALRAEVEKLKAVIDESTKPRINAAEATVPAAGKEKFFE